ncbi:mannose-1-phosphate guanylyltransferase/mannose-6-phosphate isomerase [Crenobacter sp. SG2305]|uniref:mannose-1-phosphate guanylyltransferase/mannose-6-phosphate isomerase n=1 Tax=Crenobacter oryzisoli TaxID=3056844 RepID=UPI0025AAEDA9|nr:mannose-1-phosphate guanylyltransferase/mannose-6-phosphate isomerase [Crenobacter sp. SG2305]MDN0084254.1 mannose-1-phosphate guanylyltransferase/mannose-6-phosphate isomerase [Crenobacter sp. SG2305]
MLPIILSGGSGSRLWPLSRSLFPKQFLPLASDRTMLQETLARLEGIANCGKPLIVCNEDHRFIVAEQLRQHDVKDATILLEPLARNTAPAIAVAALQAMQRGEDPLLLVLAADHVIPDVEAFQAAVAVAREAAQTGSLVTFGIVPTSAETGYGYIQKDMSEERNTRTANTFPVARFVEKPDLATAHAYVESGEYLWNSGMFLFRASSLLAELEKFVPEILTACRAAVMGASRDMDFIRLDKAAFAESPEDSIDYAVMEKTDKAVVVPLSAGWSDVGSWSALWEVADKNLDGNVEKGDVLTVNSHNCYLHSADGRVVAAVGVEDLIVVDTDDAVLVAHKDRVQDVKKVVEQLKADNRPEANQHRVVYRPWGCYDSIDSGERYQVKRITVNPGAKLSVQMHHHRAEHWVVVSGTARVLNGDKEVLLTENQSIYIPVGVVHALENPGKIPLELIEVQSGAYLGEDDIVRFEDRYGRA